MNPNQPRLTPWVFYCPYMKYFNYFELNNSSMAKKPSKIIFCKFSFPLVEELAEFNTSKLQAATYAVQLHNNVLYPFEDQFYFLNTKIAGETHIITGRELKEYPSNDPEIVAKLVEYLAAQAPVAQGSKQKRGKNKRWDNTDLSI